MTENFIKEFSGKIIGIIRTHDNGDQEAVAWPSRQVLGFYRKQYDHTTDFTGKVITRGNTVITLIYDNKNK